MAAASLEVAQESKSIVRILVTGGGTGGHVTPALAVIETLRTIAREADWLPLFCYIGSEGGLEAKLARDAGVEFIGVKSGKLRRASSWIGLLSVRNFLDALRVPIGVGQSLAAVKKFHPDAVLATGGYVSVPPVIAAGLLKIPVLIHEQTVQVGLANKIAAHFATKIAMSHESSIAELRPELKCKAFVTGNPIRKDVLVGNRDRAISFASFDPAEDDLPTVYVTGGAQGARSINRALLGCLDTLLQSCRIIWQCGKQDFDEMSSAVKTLEPQMQRRVFVTAFVGTEIGDIYALADLLVGRSGAGTVSEAAALEKPAIFIPLVPTGGDEQTRNALRSADAGAALVIKNAELTSERLQQEIINLLANSERRTQMGLAAKSLSRPNAAQDLANAILQLARPS